MKLYIQKSETGDGTPIALDDMLLTKGLATTAGSRMLDGYVSLFEAEVVTRLEKAGYFISGKANVGEFAIDLLGETSYYGATVDDSGRLVGASAELVRTGEVKAAINLDVNGLPRRAAALSGTVFIKPTYGLVSRYGTIPMACSGETVGVTARTAADASEILKVIAGYDSKDGTSLDDKYCDFSIDKSVSGIKIAVPKSLTELADRTNIDRFAEIMCSAGAVVEEIDAKELLMAQSAWNILMSAEICNNVSRYDGVKFGYRTPNYKNIDELYVNSRTESFGQLIKTVILYGSDVLSTERYMSAYDKALRIRRVLSCYFNDLFSKYDLILLPACSKTEYKASDVNDSIEEAYFESVFTAPASITGLPAVVAGGVQLIGNMFAEKTLLGSVAAWEEASK